MGEFADIRPYNDDEVATVVGRLVADRELISTAANLKAGTLAKTLPWLIHPLAKWLLTKQFRGVDSVDSFQTILKRYMDSMVDSTTTRFTVSGLDALDSQTPYLFMSNHRDIALDPAFVNYALYHNGRDTVRIAIGDNLLTKPFVSDLMRINKSFIVRRSAKGPRQILATYKLLSAYISHSIKKDCSSIWIAQREGRAKNGVDRTEPAIIKMLTMHQKKSDLSFSDYIQRLNIVPVAISYELDPCDGAKAKELYEKEMHGRYEKAEHEDVSSIAKGITGEKGHVHVSFGTPLKGDFEDADAVAKAVDRQIINNYKLHPTNFFAYKMLNGRDADMSSLPEFAPEVREDLKNSEKNFQQRIQQLPEEHRDKALAIYANSISCKQQLMR